MNQKFLLSNMLLLWLKVKYSPFEGSISVNEMKKHISIKWYISVYRCGRLKRVLGRREVQFSHLVWCIKKRQSWKYDANWRPGVIDCTLWFTFRKQEWRVKWHVCKNKYCNCTCELLSLFFLNVIFWYLEILDQGSLSRSSIGTSCCLPYGGQKNLRCRMASLSLYSASTKWRKILNPLF